MNDDTSSCAAGCVALHLLIGIVALPLFAGLCWSEVARYFRGELIEGKALDNRTVKTLVSTGEGIYWVDLRQTQVAFGTQVEWLNGTVTPSDACVVLIDPMTDSKRLAPISTLDSFVWPSFTEGVGMLLAAGALVSCLLVQSKGLLTAFRAHRTTFNRSRMALPDRNGQSQLSLVISRLAVMGDFVVSLLLSVATVVLWFGCCWLLVASLTFHDSPARMKREIQVTALLMISHISLPALALLIQRKVREHPVLRPLMRLIRHAVLLVVVGGALYNLSRSAFADEGWKKSDSLRAALIELGKALIGL